MCEGTDPICFKAELGPDSLVLVWVTRTFLQKQFCGTKCREEAAKDGQRIALLLASVRSDLWVPGWSTEPIVAAETQMGSPCQPWVCRCSMEGLNLVLVQAWNALQSSARMLSGCFEGWASDLRFCVRGHMCLGYSMLLGAYSFYYPALFVLRA